MSVDNPENKACEGITIAASGIVNSLGARRDKVMAAYLSCLPNFTPLEIENEQQAMLASLNESLLEPLPDSMQTLAISEREQRMLRLASMALSECLSQVDSQQPVPVYLALPRIDEVPNAEDFPIWLSHVCPELVVAERCRIFCDGRA